MAFDFEGLYRENYDAIVRFLYRKVWDADRAEDLAQEVFLRALSHQPDKPRAWAFTVAANIARDEARTAIRRRRHLVLLTQEPSAAPTESPDAETRLLKEEREEEVRLALAELTERDREVLLLWDAGLTYPEIADQTGLAQGAVGTTLARARKRLVEAHEHLETSRMKREAGRATSSS